MPSVEMNRFFGLTIQPHSPGDLALALLLAVALGGLIGLEREIKGHPAGLRTHILVCLGSTLITLASIGISHTQGGTGDPGHVAAQIVSGIGFLGAGAILREGATVRGLTTAASVWTTAGLGIAIGTGPFYGEIAVLAALIALVTLMFLNPIERWVDVRAKRPITLVVEVRDSGQASASALAQVAAHSLLIQSVEFQDSRDSRSRLITLRVCLPDQFDRTQFVTDISAAHGVLAVNFP